MKVGLHSGYLEACFSESATKEIIKKIKNNLKGVEFDGFLVQGLSGIVMGTLVSRAMKKKLVISRKGEKTHGMLVENIMDNDKLIILDDFCSTGATIRKIFRTLGKFQAWFYTGDQTEYRTPKVEVLGSIFYCRGCVFVPGADAAKIIKNIRKVRSVWSSNLQEWMYTYN